MFGHIHQESNNPHLETKIGKHLTERLGFNPNNKTTVDPGINEDEEYYDSLTCESASEDSPDDTLDSERMHIDVRGSLSPTQRKRTLTMSPDSPEETEYWDPVSDTYRNKRMNKSVAEESRQFDYIVGRSNDSTSGPGPIYMIGAQIY